MGLRLPLAAISTTHHAANLLRWCVSGSHSAAPLLFVYCCLLVVLLPVVHQPASLITALLVLRPSCSVGCCISQCFSLFLLSCLRPVPWPLPFIMPQPCLRPSCLVGCPVAQRLNPLLSQLRLVPWPPPLVDPLLVTAFGVVCRRSPCRIRPVRRHLPQSGRPPNIAVSGVVQLRCRANATATAAAALASPPPR